MLISRFSEIVVVTVTVTITVYGAVGSAGCFANIIVLLNFQGSFANTGFSVKEMWSQRTESLPKVT